MLITPICIPNPTSSQAPDISNQMAHRPLTLTCLPQLLPTSANGSTTHQLLTTPRKPLSSAAHITPTPPQHHQLFWTQVPPSSPAHLSPPFKSTDSQNNLRKCKSDHVIPLLKTANGFPLHLEIKFKLFISSEGALQDLALPAAPKPARAPTTEDFFLFLGGTRLSAAGSWHQLLPLPGPLTMGSLIQTSAQMSAPPGSPVTDQPHYFPDPAPSQPHHLKQARLQAALLPELT